MPVDGGGLVQQVGDTQYGVLTFFQTNQRARTGTVNGNWLGFLSVNRQRFTADRQRYLGSFFNALRVDIAAAPGVCPGGG